MAGRRQGATVGPMTTTTTTAESGYVDLDGVRTYHEITGAGDPLVLLHGGMCTIDTFGELAGFECEFTVESFHLYVHDDVVGWQPTRDFPLSDGAVG